MITLDDIKNNEEISGLINTSCKCLEALNYTEHGLRHANIVSNMAGRILAALKYNSKDIELARIAGYVHDLGNAVNRKNHGVTGAVLLYPILKQMGMPYADINIILSAVGNHEEEIGTTVNQISAAVIIADKSDAHRTRVKKGKYDPDDIHDRVNYSIKKNFLVIDSKTRTISSKYYMTDASSVMEFFQIYLSRIDMSEKAAKYLNCTYNLYINDVRINSPKRLSPSKIAEIENKPINGNNL
ncbi:MAG: HD domain-containing protein [Christensenellales bacterium]|jgi:metal-dependent HD superfamily phosphatase/phosphodiesterase